MGKSKKFFSIIFILFAILLLIFYLFIPFGTTVFETKLNSPNFNLNKSKTENMQFYPNMRYPDSKISYKIDDCPPQKNDDMLRAFEIISNITLLEFYPVNHNEEISISCNSKNKIQDEWFIGGEGGPIEVVKGEKFNVILHGKVLLIKESKCERPNIAIHELLHALGFAHSDNPNNIMYYLSKCSQTIGEDIPRLINEIYSIPSYSDLSFENVSAVMHGRYLNTNISIRNNGLKDSEKAKLLIYADEKFVKEIEFESIKIGCGKRITLKNLWTKKMNVKKLEFFINSSFNELEKNNNKVVLEIKK